MQPSDCKFAKKEGMAIPDNVIAWQCPWGVIAEICPHTCPIVKINKRMDTLVDAEADSVTKLIYRVNNQEKDIEKLEKKLTTLQLDHDDLASRIVGVEQLYHTEKTVTKERDKVLKKEIATLRLLVKGMAEELLKVMNFCKAIVGLKEK